MNCYSFFTTNEIRPEGWLKRQLQIQADGLSGNLDKIWPDIKDSKWIGGSKDGWERVPYWLDGFIPLAYLLEDEDMINRAKKYIDAILEGQCDDGWICPCSNAERKKYDIWAAFLILKVLVLYCDCSGDERIESAVAKAIACLDRHIDKYPLKFWGKYRWFECLIPLKWLYDKTGDEKLLEFAEKLKKQGFDYERHYAHGGCKKARNVWTFKTHVVNTAMAFKAPALYETLFDRDSQDRSKKMLEYIRKYHGTCTEHFTGDECLNGLSPVQGAELCSVAEAMYSYEILLAVTGDTYWGDVLEKISFNSFPATNSDDMWTHQYDQQINQIACANQKHRKIYGTNSGESNRFGLEPNFGCCTANMNQAFPKLALSAFMKSEKGIFSAVLVPSSVNTVINGVNVKITLVTDYPFKENLSYIIETEREVEFEFSFRIPKWADATVDGKAVKNEKVFKIRKLFCGKEEISIVLKSKPQLKQSPNGLYHLEKGPLIYSLPIKYEKKKLEYVKDGAERKCPYCDYEFLPVSPWNYAFDDAEFEVIEKNISDMPFSRTNPPIEIVASMVKIPWKTKWRNPYVCTPKPKDIIKIAEPEKLSFVPYGSTYLRMTDMPRFK
ncbi:MAG: beta-L-arabinofuranosidase domain-containing protein [Eubacterium sp.]